MFKAVSPKIDFLKMEKEIFEWWNKNQIMQKYLDRNTGASKTFSFIDGPITANNPMGAHHAWGRSYKDLFQRFKAMQGFDQRFQNGFDGQGLWIEVEVEKELGLGSKREIEAFGIDKFVNLCKERVRKFSEIITNQSIRLGYWMHWDNSYHTMSDENNYTIWKFLKECHNRGWIYEGNDVMPWCPRCGTGLSQHEIVTEGYKEIQHPGLYVKFPLMEETTEFLLVWTTTPWTLPSNVAAAVNPEKIYSKVAQNDQIFFVAKDLIKSTIAKEGKFTILDEMYGKSLVGKAYRAPFEELSVQKGIKHQIVEWDEVSETEGTGIVHIAPGAGKDDLALARKLGLPIIASIDESGNFIDGFGDFTNQNVYDVNRPIYQSLREKNIFYRLDSYLHRYPVCWRCDSELVFRIVDEWFISMNELRHMIAKVTKKINWVPSFGMDRELDWLRNMDDWMISKKRYYGLALPIYKCSCGHIEIIGSKDELKEKAISGWDSFSEQSPHRPWIDNVKIECTACSNPISRIQDVGNAWLDAGIVPFSTLNYTDVPDYWRKWFPADWISESFPGQFRNWFYSLLTMSTVLENTEPFKTVFSYALMRDEKGEEMHKSKGNAIWFEDAADIMGVDCMRWLYMKHNPAANLNFGYHNADEVRRQFIIPLWNVYSFFTTYANIDEYNPNQLAPKISDRSQLDQWILSELHSMINSVTTSLEKFEPDTAARTIESFVEILSNWYVRRGRRRFWKEGRVEGKNVDPDKLSAYSTLHECLLTMSKLLAPFMPFLSESMYQNLSGSLKTSKQSVHLEDYPISNSDLIDEKLSKAIRLAMKLSSLGRAARNNANIKVRQPLDSVQIKLREVIEIELLPEISEQLKDELNIKNINIIENPTEVMDISIKPNMALLGPRLGQEVRNLLEELKRTDPLEIHSKIQNEDKIELAGHEILPGELEIIGKGKEGFSATEENNYVVAIATKLTSSLINEGIAREIVHRIQTMRKNAGFEITDHIETFYFGDNEIVSAIADNKNYFSRETLSEKLINEIPPTNAFSEEQIFDGLKVTLGIVRI